ncbi:MAG: hypothetical protein QM744_19720 [Mesorhizobium sp.]
MTYRAALCGLCLTALGGFIFAEKNSIAGDYDRLIVGEDNGLVTGSFHDCTGERKFECAFSFEGRRQGNQFRIRAYETDSKEAIPGTLIVDGKNLTLRLETLPGGCWNVEPELNKAGARVLLNAALPWLGIATLKEESHLYDDQGKKTSARFGKLQTVGILKKKPGWVLIEKLSNRREKGWIRDSALYPLHNPSLF